MYTKKTIILLISCVSAAMLHGCTLEDGYSWGETCLISGDGGTLQYIQLESGRCYADTAQTIGLNAEDAALCTDVRNRGAFEQKRCPEKSPSCRLGKDGYYCTSGDIVVVGCSTVDDCTGLEAWADGRCEDGRCVASACKEIDGKQYKVVGETCTFNSCPTGQHVKDGACVNDDIAHCGSESYSCAKLPGWLSGECTTSEDNNSVSCKASSCMDNYTNIDGVCIMSCTLGTHNKNGTCADDTIEACGSETNNCTALEAWADGRCENGRCIATLCREIDGRQYKVSGDICVFNNCPTGQHIKDGQCIADSDASCGSETNNCTLLAGWDKGKCTSGTCVSTACKMGYHLDNNKCIADTNDACGESDIKCTGTAKPYCSGGVCTLSCSGGTTQCTNGCFDTKTSSTNCGSCGNDCNSTANLSTLHASNAYCANSGCKASICAAGYHIDSTGACVADSASKCGSETNNCTLLAGWDKGNCTSGTCVSTACKTGYHIDNNKCAADTNEVCGASKAKCTGTAKPYCTGGVCSLDCAGGTTKCTNGCFDTKTSSTNCGSCGNDCNSTANLNTIHAANAYCSAGACKPSMCSVNYHMNSTGTCVLDTNTACGSETNDCTALAGWSTAVCKSGKCEAQSCKTGYHLDNNKCVADTNEVCGASKAKCTGTAKPYCTGGVCSLDCAGGTTKCINGCFDTKTSSTNCGSCGNDCNSTANLNTIHAANAYCANSTCKPSICAAGYHIDSTGACVADSASKCGSETNNCTLLAGWKSGTCTNGVCKSTACAVGYHLDNNKCIADTNDACGASKTKCTGTAKPYCSGGVCTLSCSGGTKECTNGCFDTNTSSTNCGSCGNDCNSTANLNTIHAANAYCSAGACKPSMCSVNYHMNSTGTCVLDTNTACGSETNDCTARAGWSTAVCKSGKCEAQSCKTGYHIENRTCVADTNSACGSTANNCTARTDGKTLCSSGACVSKCSSGQDICGGTCINKAATHVTECQPMASTLNCASDYLNCDDNVSNGCESYLPTDINNCGICGNACNSMTVPHSTGSVCSNGSCIAVACESNYHLRNGQCVSNTCTSGSRCSGTTLQTCVNHEWVNVLECGTMTLPNTTASCSPTAGCSYACKTGYSDCSGRCINLNTDTNHCGACGNACTASSSATGVACQGGKCVSTGCKANHILGADGQCYPCPDGLCPGALCDPSTYQDSCLKDNKTLIKCDFAEEFGTRIVKNVCSIKCLTPTTSHGNGHDDFVTILNIDAACYSSSRACTILGDIELSMCELDYYEYQTGHVNSLYSNYTDLSIACGDENYTTADIDGSQETPCASMTTGFACENTTEGMMQYFPYQVKCTPTGIGCSVDAVGGYFAGDPDLCH